MGFWACDFDDSLTITHAIVEGRIIDKYTREPLENIEVQVNQFIFKAPNLEVQLSVSWTNF